MQAVDRKAEIDDAAEGLALLAQEALRDSLGQFAIGTFTANAPSEAITFTGSPIPIINAFQLRDLGPVVSGVPEPASLTLLGIGAVGLLGYGWRRRRQSA